MSEEVGRALKKLQPLIDAMDDPEAEAARDAAFRSLGHYAALLQDRGADTETITGQLHIMVVSLTYSAGRRGRELKEHEHRSGRRR
jgi:hypothetical protein